VFDLPAGTVSFLFTDIVGSTPLWEKKPRAMRESVAKHNAILKEVIEGHEGRVFKVIGDAFQAAFMAPWQAVEAAIVGQRSLSEAEWGETGPIQVRMGVHIGTAEISEGDYVASHTLNRVARIMSAGHGGQVLISLAVAELIRGNLPPEVQLKDLGEHYLKGLSHAEHIFQVSALGLGIDFPPLVTRHAARGYKLLEQIGLGGFGAVYRAVQPEVGREVAVKIILPAYANDPDFIRRFDTEAQTIARLEHPHIVPLYDYWREPDGAYLVMRWVRGGSLEEILDQGYLDTPRLVRVAEQIATALDAAHLQGVVHRDLKPANILIDESGNAYLSDFGIAKYLSENGQHSLSGGLAGSPAYMSPEQLLKEPLTPRSDIYSFGLVIYRMCTGELAFPVDSLAALIDKHLHEPLPPVTALRPDLPGEVDEILQKATAKDPDRRYPDAGMLVRALKAALAGTVIPQIEFAQPRESLALELHNPYKGLSAFQETDAEDFYGREALVERLLDRLVIQENRSSTNGYDLEEGRFLAVVGPSGSGKSSLIKAGLIPALRSGRLAGSEKWFIVEMLPGTHPLEELEAALLRVAVNPPESLLAQIKEDERGLVRAVKRVLPGGEEAELVLVIDQFEEIFTLVEDRQAARFFLDSLVNAVSDPRGQLRVIITIRADFYDRPLMITDFSQLVQAGTEVVIPLTAEELVEAIREPAARVGARFESGLVPRIVTDVNEQPGALPLLQYSLTELFERREGDFLTNAAYEQIGGVLGALSRRAEEVFQGLEEGEQVATRQIFLRLVTLGEGVEDTRRRVLRSELEAISLSTPDGSPASLDHAPRSKTSEPGNRVARVLEAFGRARLLSFDRDPSTRSPTVEVAHEALLREWGRLRGWLEESREDVRLQRLLSQMARDWEESGEDSSFLLRGNRLEFIDAWRGETEIDLTRVELAYVQASLAEREVRRREEVARKARETTLERRSRNILRALFVVMVLATAVSLYLSGFAFRQRDSARQNEALAERSALTATVAQGQALLDAATAVAAQDKAQASALAEAAARRLATSRELVRFAEAELQNPTDPSFSLALLLARESVLTTWRSDQSVLPEAERVLRETVNAVPILDQQLPGSSRRVLFAAWSPDGKGVVSAGADGVARIWDTVSGDQVLELEGQSGDIHTADWSPDGARILTASQDKTIRIWDARSGDELKSIPYEEAVASAFWSPDGSRILVAVGNKARVLDAQSGETLIEVQKITGNFSFGAWSPSGDRFATADNINSVQVWDVATGQQVDTLEANNSPVNSVQWSEDGRYLLSAHVGKLARIWDIEAGSWLDLIHDAPVQFAAWNPDDSQVATVTDDGRITIWDAITGKMVRQWRAQGQIIWSLAWSPDGSQLLTSDEDGSARIWEVKTLGERNNLQHRGPVLSVSWSPDGSRLLTAGGLILSADVWDVGSGSLFKQLPHPGSVQAVAWSPKGDRVATASLNTVYLWNANSGEKIGSLPSGPGVIDSLAWNRSGVELVVGGQDRTARILDVTSGKLMQTLEGHSGTVLSASWSPDDSRIVTASSDHTARVWDVQTGQELLVLSGHTDQVNAALFSPDGETILTASSDHTARLWEARTGKLLHVLEGHTGSVRSVAWSPDGSLVATAGDDGLVLLWDPQTGERKGEVAQHSAAVWAVAWSPDGSWLASASQDETVRISPIGIEGLLEQAEKLIRRDPPEFSPEERCLYLHDCEG
jgi:WD40 repeat protein/serine/threonine protein kinase/class 3 adenylate cyclase